jgi:hypothetical protein
MTERPEREVDDRIADWVDGRLAGRDRERFVAELRVNAQLRKDLEEYERTVAALRAALQAPTHRIQLADRVLAAIAEGRAAGSERRNRPWVRTWVWSVATAAALLVVALLVNAWSEPPKIDLRAKVEDQDAAPAAAGRAEQVFGGRPESDPGARDDGVAKDVGGGGAPAAKPGMDREAPGAPVQPEDFYVGATRAEGQWKDKAEETADQKQAGSRAEAEGPRYSLPVPPVAPAAAAPADGRPTAGPEAAVGPAAGSREAPPAGSAGKSEAALEEVSVLSLEAAETPSAAGEPREVLPLVVVEGVLDDVAKRRNEGRMRTGSEGTKSDRGSAATKSAAPQALAQLDLFFRDQLTPPPVKKAASESPADQSFVVAGLPSLRLQPLPPRAMFERRAGAPAGEERKVATDDRAAADADAGSLWLVEGSKQEVAQLLGRLSAFAAASNLRLRTSEAAGLAEPAPAGGDAPSLRETADRDRAGAVRRTQDQDRARVMLQFRIDRR